MRLAPQDSWERAVLCLWPKLSKMMRVSVPIPKFAGTSGTDSPSDLGRLYGLMSCCRSSLLVNVKDVVVPLALI